MTDRHLDALGPWPFKNCPQCDKRWPLASYRDADLCFYCMNAEAA